MTAAFSVSALLYPNDIAFIYALLETARMAGRTIGPSVGGGLFSAGGFGLPFYLMGSFMLVSGLLSMILHFKCDGVINLFEMPSSEEQAAKRRKQRRNSDDLSWFHYFTVSPHAWVLCICQGITSVLFSFPEPTLSLYFAILGMDDPATVGLVFLAGSTAYASICLIVSKVSNYQSQLIYWFMAVGSLVLAISLLLLGPAPPFQSTLPPSTTLTIIATVLLYSGVALIISPVPKAFLISLRSAGYPDSLATSSYIASLYNGWWFLGGSIGPTVAGALMTDVGFPNAAAIMSGFAFLLILTTAYGIISLRINIFNRNKKPKDIFAKHVAGHDDSTKIISLLFSYRN